MGVLLDDVHISELKKLDKLCATVGCKLIFIRSL